MTWIAKLFFGFFQKIDSEGFLSIAVELVESDAIDFEKAQLAIEELGRAGIKSYIDDFGTGYSSIERVARLAVYGVKLDRSFAMSPPDSVLGRMLVQVIDMIKTSGHLIVVEGVETEARLNLLRSTGVVDYVQGYVLSRPLGIEEFIAFLRMHGMTGGRVTAIGREALANWPYFASSSFTFAASCGSENGLGRNAKSSEPMVSRKASFG